MRQDISLVIECGLLTLHCSALNPDGFALRFIEIRNTNAAAQVPVAELVNATLPDVVLTMEAWTRLSSAVGNGMVKSFGWWICTKTKAIPAMAAVPLGDPVGRSYLPVVRRRTLEINFFNGGRRPHQWPPRTSTLEKWHGRLLATSRTKVSWTMEFHHCWTYIGKIPNKYLWRSQGFQAKNSNFERHTLQWLMVFVGAGGRQKPFALCRDWVLLLRWATCLGTSKDLHQVAEMVVLWQVRRVLKKSTFVGIIAKPHSMNFYQSQGNVLEAAEIRDGSWT